MHDNKSVYISNQAFRVRSYARVPTDDLVSRFGSSESGQTNLDLLKAETQKSFRGGMFQRTADDPEKVSTITNGYFNKLDNGLYPTPDWTTALNGVDLGPNGVTSWAVYKGLIYFTFQAANPGSTGMNRLWTLNPVDGSITFVPGFPNALRDNVWPIRLLSWGTWLLIAASPGNPNGTSWTYDGTTFTGGAAGFHDFGVFGDKLYGIDAAQSFYQITAVSAGTFTIGSPIAVVSGVSTTNLYQCMVEYNNALYIALQNGLYRFDGVAIRPVLDYRRSVHAENFKYMAAYNGRLYYTIRNKLFQFDGTNIEELQDFTEGYTIKCLVAVPDRLWIGALVNTGIPYTDKYTSGATTYRFSLFAYNGVGFFEYTAFTQDIPVSYTVPNFMPINNKVYSLIPDIYLNTSLEPRSNGVRINVLDLNYEFSNIKPAASMTVISSEFNNNYPSVSKTFDGLLTNYGGLKEQEFTIRVYAQYLNNNAWSSFTEVWNSQEAYSGAITNDYYLHEQSNAGGLSLFTTPAVYNKMRFKLVLTRNVSGAAFSCPAIYDLTMRYAIQPKYRLKWLLELDINGVDNSDRNFVRNSDNTVEDRSSTYLRKIIQDAVRLKLPVLFYDADYSKIKAVNSGTEIVVSGTDWLTARDRIAAADTDGEQWLNRSIQSVVYDDAQDQTTVTLYNAGFRRSIGGSTDFNFSVDTELRKSHAVYIRRITNERYILNEETVNPVNGHSDIGSTMTLEIVEL